MNDADRGGEDTDDPYGQADKVGLVECPDDVVDPSSDAGQGEEQREKNEWHWVAFLGEAAVQGSADYYNQP